MFLTKTHTKYKKRYYCLFHKTNYSSVCKGIYNMCEHKYADMTDDNIAYCKECGTYKALSKFVIPEQSLCTFFK